MPQIVLSGERILPFLSLGAFHALDVFNFYWICCHTLLQVDVAEPHKGLLTEIALLFLKSDAIFM